MPGINQYHARHLVGILASVNPRVQPAGRVADQHVGWFDTRAGQQRALLRDIVREGPWIGAGLAPAQACPVKGAGPRELGHPGQNRGPGHRGLPVAAVHHDGGSRSRVSPAVNVHLKAAHVHHPSRWRVLGGQSFLGSAAQKPYRCDDEGHRYDDGADDGAGCHVQLLVLSLGTTSAHGTGLGRQPV